MSSISRRCIAAVVALTGAMSLHAAVSVERSVEPGRITRVAAHPAADLVLVEGGHEAGLRQGMVCVASRAGQKIGELLLVDLRPLVSSALILDLESGLSLQPGDLVAVKTVSSRK